MKRWASFFRTNSNFRGRKKLFVNYGVIQKKTNDGRTNWIVPRNEKKLSFFKNEQKTKTNDLKSLKRTNERTLRTNEIFFWTIKKGTKWVIHERGRTNERNEKTKQICHKRHVHQYMTWAIPLRKLREGRGERGFWSWLLFYADKRILTMR